MKKIIAAGVVAGVGLTTGLLGMGMGYVASDGIADVQTKTVEVTVPGPTITKTVKVPGPTRTKTVQVEKKVDVPQTPDSCLEALDAAEQMADHAAEFSSIAQTYLPLIQEAYEAGATYSPVDSIISKMEAGNARFKDLNARVRDNRDRYNSAAQDCKSH